MTISEAGWCVRVCVGEPKSYQMASGHILGDLWPLWVEPFSSSPEEEEDVRSSPFPHEHWAASLPLPVPDQKPSLGTGKSRWVSEGAATAHSHASTGLGAKQGRGCGVKIPPGGKQRKCPLWA